MRAKVKMEGFSELNRKLANMAKALPKSTQIEVLTEAGEIIADEARILVPVDSGTLRDSISVSDVRLGGAFSMDRTLGDGAQVFIGPRTRSGPPDGYYGHFLEFGTVKMAAQPFMRPAFDNTHGQVVSRIASELQMRVAKVAKG